MSPKQYFLTNKVFVAAHNGILDNPQFRISADYAMLQMQRDLVGWNMEESKARERFYMMAGAQYFLGVLNGLGHVQEKEPPQGLPPNLTH